jgi:hypothetical protein
MRAREVIVLLEMGAMVEAVAEFPSKGLLWRWRSR